MNAAHRSQALSPRDREILRDVIRTFILSGEPVSSRAVARQSRHGVSSATVRNVMADLEELGYLSQPHTSAGRVPTRVGYHFYIDALMETRSIPVREKRLIDENLASVPADAEKLMGATTHLLSQLSSQIGIVVTPAMGETVLKAIDFVPLTGKRVLCVVVSATGFVDSKVIELDQPLSREELISISNYLGANFVGLSLRAIRERLLGMMAEERAQVDRLLAGAILLARQALSGDVGPELLVEGTASLLTQPELADIERVRRMLDTFSDKARLVQILSRLIAGRGVRVLIGEDSDLTSDLDFSLVAGTYGVGDRVLGTLGIFGPSRMEYQHVIPLVDYLGETLSRALERALDDGPANGGDRNE